MAENAHKVLAEQGIDDREGRQPGNEIPRGAACGFKQHADADHRHHVVGGIGNAFAHHVQVQIAGVEIAVADQRQDNEQVVPAVEFAGGVAA
ncbi:hypothetical protein D3C80_1058580 [compost metagenome]